MTYIILVFVQEGEEEDSTGMQTGWCLLYHCPTRKMADEAYARTRANWRHVKLVKCKTLKEQEND